MEVKGIVTLREAVQVPAVPKIEIPPPYKVPAPGDSVVRHPIYGRDLQDTKDNVKPSNVILCNDTPWIL